MRRSGKLGPQLPHRCEQPGASPSHRVRRARPSTVASKRCTAAGCRPPKQKRTFCASPAARENSVRASSNRPSFSRRSARTLGNRWQRRRRESLAFDALTKTMAFIAFSNLNTLTWQPRHAPRDPLTTLRRIRLAKFDKGRQDQRPRGTRRRTDQNQS